MGKSLDLGSVRIILDEADRLLDASDGNDKNKAVSGSAHVKTFLA